MSPTPNFKTKKRKKIENNKLLTNRLLAMENSLVDGALHIGVQYHLPKKQISGHRGAARPPRRRQRLRAAHRLRTDLPRRRPPPSAPAAAAPAQRLQQPQVLLPHLLRPPSPPLHHWRLFYAAGGRPSEEHIEVGGGGGGCGGLVIDVERWR